MESNEFNSPRAFTSSSAPNSSSTKANSDTLASESHSAVFAVFAFARAPLGSAGNTVEKHLMRRLRASSIVFSMSRTDSFRPTAHGASPIMATALHHHQRGMHTMHSPSRASGEAPDHAPCTSTDKPDNLVNKVSTAGAFA